MKKLAKTLGTLVATAIIGIFTFAVVSPTGIVKAKNKIYKSQKKKPDGLFV